jgi:hypothetical protein
MWMDSRLVRLGLAGALTLLCLPALVICIDFLLSLPGQLRQPGGMGDGPLGALHFAFLMSPSWIAVVYIVLGQTALTAAWIRPPLSRWAIAILQVGMVDSIARVIYAHFFYHGDYQ